MNIKFTGPGKSKIQLGTFIEESEKFRNLDRGDLRDLGLLSFFGVLALQTAYCYLWSRFTGWKKSYYFFSFLLFSFVLCSPLLPIPLLSSLLSSLFLFFFLVKWLAYLLIEGEIIHFDNKYLSHEAFCGFCGEWMKNLWPWGTGRNEIKKHILNKG